MTQIRLIFKNGAFHPLRPIKMREGAEVYVNLDDVGNTGKADTDWDKDREAMLALAGSLSNEDAAQMSRAIEDAFETVDPAAWNPPHVG